eukprot:30915-Pelagococcus_subviridis.AAC.4
MLVVLADLFQTRRHLALLVVHRRRAEVSQREDLVKHRVSRPLRERRRVLDGAALGAVPQIPRSHLVKRRDRRVQRLTRRVLRAPVAVGPDVANRLLGVVITRRDDAIGAALPPRLAVRIPALTHDVLVLQKGELGEINRRGPARACGRERTAGVDGRRKISEA